MPLAGKLVQQLAFRMRPELDFVVAGNRDNVPLRRHGNRVDVYGLVVRTHFTPDIIRISPPEAVSVSELRRWLALTPRPEAKRPKSS